MSCCVAQLLRFVRLIRTLVESVACEACRNTSGPVLTPENVVTLTGPVAEVGAQLVGHVEAVRKAITDPGVLHQTEQGVVTLDDVLSFAIIAKSWILVRPIVTICRTIAHLVVRNTPGTRNLRLKI